MVPNFALSLSFEGIALLRRMGDVWARIDDVSFEADDLDTAMAALRDKALSLDPKGTDVVLILPNEQIRYMDLPDLGGDEIAREIAIRAGLDGATPYEVKDLSFDYTLSDGQIQIAAVANETLDEAQGFARVHGFTAISYAAQAPDGQFDGAVFFGKAKSWRRAARRLPRAIEIVPADEAALTPLAAPEPQPTTPEPQIAMAFDTVEEKPAETDAADQTPEPSSDVDPVGDKDAALPEVQEPEATADADAATPDAAEDTREQRRARRAERRARQQAETAAPLPDADEAGTDSDDAEAPQAINPAPAQDTAPAPTVQSHPEPGQAPPLAAVKPEDHETPTAVPVSFSTIRASRTDGATIPPAPRALKLGDTAEPARVEPRFHPVLGGSKAAVDESTAPKLSAPERTEPPADADTPPQKEKRKGLLAGKGAKLKRGLDRGKDKRKPDRDTPPPQAPKSPILAKPEPEAPSVAKPADSAPGAAAAAAAAGLAAAAPMAPGPQAKSPSPLTRLAAMRGDAATQGPAPTPEPATTKKPNAVLSRLSQSRNARPGLAAPAGGASVALNERERLTVFGMRKDQKIGGKPRFLGLMLTAALLLFLIGVAAWASVFLDEGLASLFRRDETRTEVASLPAPDAPEAAPTALVDPQAPAAPEPAAPITAAPDPEAEAEEDVEVAALDSEPAVTDAPEPLAQPIEPRILTPEEATTTYAATGIWQRTPGAPLLPPADGVDDVYVASIDPNVQQFDAVALPQPSGLAADAALEDPGLPPPADMTFDFDERGLIRATPEGALTPEGLRIFTGRPDVIPPLRQAALTPQPEARLDAPEDAEALDRLQAFRPEARPDDIIEQRERATLGGISRDELAAMRPVLRPRTVQEEATEAEPEEPATAQAVTASLVPLSRPRNMEAIVRRAEAQRPAEPVQQAAAVSQPLTPSGPTATSVARAATDPNAINLSKINLIGVYGTPSNRRALVRLPGSGKYEKVKTGDRLDGGRVQSISESALIYVKNGRAITLQMPRG